MPIIILSGPIGAGKTTVGLELAGLLPAPVFYIEGDRFWPFIAKPHSSDRRELAPLIMRSMLAAAIAPARSGYTVVVDFSVPPQFLPTTRKIVKDLPLSFVVLRPSLTVCEARALARREGKIEGYQRYRDFYALFEEGSAYEICDDEAGPRALAERIRDGLGAGVFRVA